MPTLRKSLLTLAVASLATFAMTGVASASWEAGFDQPNTLTALSNEGPFTNGQEVWVYGSGYNDTSSGYIYICNRDRDLQQCSYDAIGTFTPSGGYWTSDSLVAVPSDFDTPGPNGRDGRHIYCTTEPTGCEIVPVVNGYMGAHAVTF